MGPYMGPIKGQNSPKMGSVSSKLLQFCKSFNETENFKLKTHFGPFLAPFGSLRSRDPKGPKGAKNSPKWLFLQNFSNFAKVFSKLKNLS